MSRPPHNKPRRIELQRVTEATAPGSRFRPQRPIAHGLWALCLLCVTGFDSSPGAESTELGTALQIHPQTKLVFADVSRARKILVRRDRFVMRMSDLDRRLRLPNELAPTERIFLQRLGEQARGWSNEEMTHIRATLQPVIEALSGLRAVWPTTVVLVKTTAQVEDGAPHCRQEAVILPEPFMSLSADLQRRILVHELFHVLSTHSPELRSRLYNLIGFQECPAIQLPPSLQRRKITNPDAPEVNCVTHLVHDQQTLPLAPLLLSRHDVSDLPADTTIFRELDFRLVVVEPDGAGWRIAGGEDHPILYSPHELPGWRAKIGRNTRYIIHPEEILADNFIHLILPGENLPDPWLVAGLADLLRP